METAKRVTELLSNNPGLNRKELAKICGVSKQRISQICKKHGLNPVNVADTRPPPPQLINGLGGTAKLSPNFVGSVSELTAATDLLRRGIPVYKALTFVSSVDLIVDIDQSLVRVEVRSARTASNGRWTYATPADRSRYDVLAVVNQHGEVRYKPENVIPDSR